MGLIAALVLFAALLAYIFWPDANPFVQRGKSRLDYLEERKDAVLENLRDLNFEFRAGKYPAEDYEAQRAMLEAEAATVLQEMDSLGSVAAAPRT